MSSEACMKSGAEYILLPGVYAAADGRAVIMVICLGPNKVLLRCGQILARGKPIPDILLKEYSHESEENSISLNICRISEQATEENYVIENADINSNTELHPKDKDQLCSLLNEFKDCFASSNAELGQTTLAEMRIRLKDDAPVTYRPYRLSLSERAEVKKIINDLLENQIIRESDSEFASPIIVVPKKNGDLRLCIDYRALNKKTYKNKYPMLLIEDQVDSLSGQVFFTTLDLTSGYHQIPMAEDSKHLTAFVTPDGHFEYNRMPFGLCNAPAVFQRLIHKILNAKKIPGVLAYMDDIIISSQTVEEGMQKLRQVLEALKDANLTLNLGKCNFFRTEVEYLGYEISRDGIKPGKRKAEAVKSFKRPSNAHEIRQFIGLASFFSTFRPGFCSFG